MAPLGTRSLALLAGVKRQTLDRANALADYATSLGGDIGILSGLRSYEKQAQLYADSLAAEAAGQPHLPAAAPGTSAHETGDAFDVTFNVVPPGMTLDQFQRALADYSRTIGLKPGYYFHDAQGKADPDPPHFQNAIIEPDKGGAGGTSDGAGAGGLDMTTVVGLIVVVGLVGYLVKRRLV